MPGLVMVMLPLFPLAGYEGLVWGRLGIFDHGIETKKITKKKSSLGIFCGSDGSRASRRFGSGVAQSEWSFRSHNHP